jgi:hypothetical protein
MDADDKLLTQTERLALVDRDSGGRFVKGHKKSSPGRPVDAVNKLTRSLREQVLDGIGDIPTFIGELKRDSLPACAGLLPPAENGDDARQGGTAIVNIYPSRAGHLFCRPVSTGAMFRRPCVWWCRTRRRSTTTRLNRPEIGRRTAADGGLPSLTPRALACASAALVRWEMSARSFSARAA